MEFRFSKCLFLVVAIGAVLLWGCGSLTATDPAADGARFNKRYNYYYAEDCRYDGIGPYDCRGLVSIPQMTISLRIDSDGLANLFVNSDHYVYLESEYTEGYESGYGSYYRFYEDDGKLDVYTRGDVAAFWGDDGYVSFFYYDLDY